MTQTPLNFDAPPSRDTLAQRVAAYFRARPGEWVDVLPLADIGGLGGWRSRVSDVRLYLGMPIENRIVRWPDGRKRSQYRFVPELATVPRRIA